jgi:molybdate transport system substrate-binding protein
MTAGRFGTLVAAVCVAVVSSMSAQSPSARPAPLRVIASNGVKTFVDALVPAYENASGRPVSLTFGTSSGLVAEIIAGAPFDVVIATADAVAQVRKAGKTSPEAGTVIGHTPVGLGVKKGAKKPAARTAAELTQALLAAKAVTYAGNGASRPHIEAMFTRLGVSDVVKRTALLEQGSERAIARVVAGDADLLITLVSEIMPAAGIDLVGPLPSEFRSDVTFTAAVGASAGDPAAARALIASLVSPAATPTLRQKGLER